MKKTSLLLIIVTIITLASCSVQKRHYMNGYSVNWNNTHPTSAKVESKQEQDISPAEEEETENKNDELTASTEAAVPLLPAKTPLFSTKSAAGDSCDIIDFIDHQRILVKVLEIDQVNIKYKKCGVANAPEQTVAKSKVNYILFSNGLKEVMHVTETVTAPVKKTIPAAQNGYTEPQDHISAKMSWIFGICAYIPIVGWIFALMAIIHGAIALTSINNKPEKYKGATQAIVGIALGVLGLIAGAIVVMLTLGGGFF